MVTGVNSSISTAQSNDNTVVDYVNGPLIGLIGDGLNTLNNKLQATDLSLPATVASPGLSGAIAHFPAPASIPNVAATIHWTPVELTSALNLTMTQMLAIVSGIGERQQVLNAVRATKTGEIGAFSDIVDVIAYDVTTGWA